MTFTTDIYAVDLILAVVLDKRLQMALVTAWLIQWALRLPRPRKGAGHKAIFVTSCDSGIGQRIAKRFDDMKANVFVGSLDPKSPEVQKFKASCSPRLHVIPLDLADEKSIEETVAYVKANMPVSEKGLYGLVNNAGILSYSNFELASLEHCKQVIDTNLLGTVRVTKHFLPLIKKVQGRIVNVTSILSRLTTPNTAIYAATKHGLNGFFSTLQYDLTSAGIHVATVEPGYFSTTTDIMEKARVYLEDMWKNLSREEQKAKLDMYEDAKKLANKTEIFSKKQEENYKRIVEDVEDAMFAEEAYHRYVSAPWSQRLLLSFFRMLPEDWYGGLVSRRSQKKK